MTASALPGDLAAAIEHAYKVFAGYRFANTVPCDCCHTEEELEQSRRRLTETPLRALALGDVDYVCLELLPMWGDQADAKVLAPRLLELVSASWLLGVDLGSSPSLGDCFLSEAWTLRLFDLGGWHTWSATERQAVEVCLRSLWHHLVAMPAGLPLSSWADEEPLLAILSLGPEVRPYLDRFHAGPNQARHLAWFIRAFVASRGEREFGVRRFDEEVEALRAQIDAWLHTDAVRATLVRAIANPASKGFRWELVLGLLQLRRASLIEFERASSVPQWVPDAEALALAAELGVDLGRDSLQPGR